MGGICSRRSTEDNASGGAFPQVNGHSSNDSGGVYQSRELVAQANNCNSAPSLVPESTDKKLREPFSFPNVNAASYGLSIDDINDGIPRLSRALSNKSRSTSKAAAVAKVRPIGLSWIFYYYYVLFNFCGLSYIT